MNIFGHGRNQQIPEDAPLDAIENDPMDRYWRVINLQLKLTYLIKMKLLLLL